jgi:prephenate dehydrogenase
MAVSAGIPQQTTTPPGAPTPNVHDPLGTKQDNDQHGATEPNEMQAKLRVAAQSERQRRLVDDTDRLLALATQLHTDVAKTNKDILSLDVIKRADEIERLAHSVKERMKAN